MAIRKQRPAAAYCPDCGRKMMYAGVVLHEGRAYYRWLCPARFPCCGRVLEVMAPPQPVRML